MANFDDGVFRHNVDEILFNKTLWDCSYAVSVRGEFNLAGVVRRLNIHTGLCVGIL